MAQRITIPMRMAIVGGGILGVTTALLSAQRGWEVELLEASPTPWSGASACNEGKIHLGLVFALGDERTHEVMLQGALAFATIVEQATGATLPWSELMTAPFSYMVMPDSLLTASELSLRYAAQNDVFDRHRQKSGCRYLGLEIFRLANPEAERHHRTGFPVFATDERAVDPRRLRVIMTAQLGAHPNIQVRADTHVTALENVAGGVVVTSLLENAAGATGVRTERFDYVVNCAWHDQVSLVPTRYRVRRNYRLKAAVRLPPLPGVENVTLVQGPFGDVVRHRDYTYASWYPSGRLTNEHAWGPSVQARAMLAEVTGQTSLMDEQLQALRALGVLPESSAGELMAGFVVGHGTQDIDTSLSPLHSRAEFGVAMIDHLVVPSNFKFTTAPLAALRAVEAIERALGHKVRHEDNGCDSASSVSAVESGRRG